MNILARLKNLWRLSAVHPDTVAPHIERINKTLDLMEKAMEPVRFIPYEPVSPISKIVNETNGN